MTPDLNEDGLRAGYRHLRRGAASYAGVIRSGRADRPAWQCPDNHSTAPAAVRCAEGELDRRRQAGREVLTLYWCEPCEAWWTRAQIEVRTGQRGRRPVGGCGRCDYPLAAVKLLVLQRGPFVDGVSGGL